MIPVDMRKAPVWFLIVVIVSILPVFQLPLLLSALTPGSGARVWIWIYPLYVITAAYLAWQCYRDRTALAWCLVALIWMSHLAIWALCFMPVQPS